MSKQEDKKSGFFSTISKKIGNYYDSIVSKNDVSMYQDSIESQIHYNDILFHIFTFYSSEDSCFVTTMGDIILNKDYGNNIKKINSIVISLIQSNHYDNLLNKNLVKDTGMFASIKSKFSELVVNDELKSKLYYGGKVIDCNIKRNKDKSCYVVSVNDKTLNIDYGKDINTIHGKILSLVKEYQSTNLLI